MSEVIYSNHNGSLNKIGTVENGRQRYELVNKHQNIKTVYSVAEKDVFEYEKTATESINYMTSINRADIEQRSQNVDRDALNKKIKIAAFSGGILGVALPAVGASLLKASKKVKLIVGIPLAIGGGISGFVSGIILASRKFLNDTVPELGHINKLADKMNKLDIQIESENVLSENK